MRCVIGLATLIALILRSVLFSIDNLKVVAIEPGLGTVSTTYLGISI